MKSYVAQRELRKISLQVVVAANSSILGDNQELFLVRPTKASNRAFIPLYRSVSVPEKYPDYYDINAH